MRKKNVTLSPGASFDPDTLKVGEKAIITLEDGRILQTSPVESYGVYGGTTRVDPARNVRKIMKNKKSDI